MKVIAHVYSDFPEKFGVPRQSGLVPELTARIVFEPEYRHPEALRGIEEFEYLWILWQFSLVGREGYQPTVRPPRLGGNTRVGVFATRSPFRPNPVGLSSVKLEHVEWDTPEGPVLVVSGADMVSGTPVYDIKPYLPYTDSHPEAKAGFTDHLSPYLLRVEIDGEILGKLGQSLSTGQITALKGILAEDPRPSYQNDPDRVYTMSYAGLEVRFRVSEGTLRVTEVFHKE